MNRNKIIGRIKLLSFGIMMLSMFVDVVLNFSAPLLFYYILFGWISFMCFAYLYSEDEIISFLALPALVFQIVFLSISSSVGEVLLTTNHNYMILLRHIALVSIVGCQAFLVVKIVRDYWSDWISRVAMLMILAGITLLLLRFPLLTTLPIIVIAGAFAFHPRSPRLKLVEEPTPPYDDSNLNIDNIVFVNDSDDEIDYDNVPDSYNGTIRARIFFSSKRKKIKSDTINIICFVRYPCSAGVLAETLRCVTAKYSEGVCELVMLDKDSIKSGVWTFFIQTDNVVAQRSFKVVESCGD